MPFGRMCWRPCLIGLTAVALAACGGRDDYGAAGGSNPPPAGNAPGTITLAVTGLATGSSGGLGITGPGGFAATIPTTQTSVAVPAAGDYTITATAVLTGSRVLLPQAATQTITVAAGAPVAAAVAYVDDRALALTLQQVVTNLVSPLFLTSPDGDARLFVVEQAGTIRVISNGVVLPTPFLSIPNPSRVLSGGERGLLSMAFDPLYASNGFFYVYFTDQTGDIAIERYQVSAGNPDIADPTPLRVLTIPHRSFANHNGGLLAFGADGMLYAATGDGGGGGDPLGSGQNLGSLLGKLLRVDVRNASSGAPYAIPADNPFVAQAGAAGEIWAYGLRNPWRFAFDPPADRLYIADVGQNRIEEINAVDATEPGLNYGWNVTEGSLCYPGGPCSTTGLTLPVLEYGHDAAGGCSVTGGFVYRGGAIPELQGRYLYSDACSGWLRSFLLAGASAVERVDWNTTNVGQVLSFGEDSQGEIYLLARRSGVGTIYRIVRQ